MRRTGILSMLALAAAVSMATQASAMTFGGEVYGAFNTYTMGDWNDAIDASNSTGTQFDNVNNGFTGGLDLRLWATPTWLVAAGWEPIFLATEDKSTPGDKASFDANAFTLTGGYFFPTGGKGKYGIGAGVGYYSVKGKFESTGSPTADLEGNTVGFHVLGMGEWTMSPGFAVTAGAGYRIAKVDEVKLGGAVVTDSGGNKIQTDYSGFEGRVGLAFYLPSASSGQ